MTRPTEGFARFADGLERSLWTVAEAAGAAGIVAGYQALPLPDVPTGYVALSIILVAGVLAGIKSAVAQRWGNGTAATLPAGLEPVPDAVAADAVVGRVREAELTQEGLGITVVVDANGDGRDDRTGRFVPKS